MNHSFRPRFVFSLLAAALLPAAAGAAPTTGSPVRVLSAVESAAADGLPYTAGSSLALRVAAAVKVSAYSQGSPRQDVQRKSGSNAAVYRSLPLSSPPLLPTAPAAGDLFDFTVIGDSAQSWATMTADGVPHLVLRGFGEFRADATASWTATVTLPATSSKEVVLRFVIPPVSVGGDTEEDGPAWWRSQLRAELLVNGYPAWSTTAMRLRADYKVNIMGSNTPQNRTLAVLQQFGEPLAFSTSDEDASTGNDSQDGNLDSPSSKKTVYLSLGRFDAGAQVHLTMIVRGIAFTQPSLPGGTDHRCEQSPAQFFCSRASMSVSGSASDGPRVHLMP